MVTIILTVIDDNKVIFYFINLSNRLFHNDRNFGHTKVLQNGR